MKRYRILVDREGCEVDLIGRGGILRNCLSNIFVTDSKELRIIDATILDFGAIRFIRPFFHLLVPGVLWRQGISLRAFARLSAKIDAEIAPDDARAILSSCKTSKTSTRKRKISLAQPIAS